MQLRCANVHDDGVARKAFRNAFCNQHWHFLMSVQIMRHGAPQEPSHLPLNTHSKSFS